MQAAMRVMFCYTKTNTHHSIRNETQQKTSWERNTEANNEVLTALYIRAKVATYDHCKAAQEATVVQWLACWPAAHVLVSSN